MANYICTDCNYKFNKEPKKANKCPYCGSGSIKVYEPTTAQDLLDGVPSD